MLPACTANDVLPAVSYIASLDAQTSKRVMLGALRKISDVIGVDAEVFDWSSIRYTHAVLIRDRLLAAGLSAHWVNLCLTAMRGIAREAWRQGKLPHEELERLLMIKQVRISRKPAGRVLRPEEIQKVLQNLNTPKQRAIMQLLLCGLRRSEVTGLFWSDYINGKLRVIGKGNKERTVPLTRNARKAMEGWRRECKGHDRVFPGRRGGEMHANTVYKVVRTAGNNTFSPHDLRRTLITRLLDTCDSATVAHIVGHESVDTTRRYDHNADRRAAEAMEGFNIS